MIIFINRYFLSWIAASTLLLFIFGGGSTDRGAKSVALWPTVIITAIAAIAWWRRDVNRQKTVMKLMAEQSAENARKAAAYDQEHAPES